MRPLAVVLLVLLSACTTPTGPDYQVGENAARVSRAQAEEDLIARAPARAASADLDAPLKVLAAPMPGYPMAFQREGITGDVKVRFRVEEDGTVSSPTLIGSPPPALAALALEAILRWRFEPIRRNGQPTRLWMQQTFAFRLE